MDITEGCCVFVSALALGFVSAFIHGQLMRWKVDRYRLRWWRRHDRQERSKRAAANKR